MYYQARIRYQVLDQVSLKVKKKRGSVLVQAELFSEAEQAALAYCAENDLHEADVTGIMRSPIKEVANAYNWTDGRCSWIVTLEDHYEAYDGSDKELRYPVLFWADSMPNASDKLVSDYVKGIDPTGNQMKVVGVKKSDIIKELDA